MIKSLKLGVEGRFLNLVKDIYETLSVNRLYEEGLKAFFPLKIINKAGCPLTASVQHGAEVLARAMRPDKEIKGIQVAKERNYLRL